jgi:hypothetical protein
LAGTGGTFGRISGCQAIRRASLCGEETVMNSIIYLIGLIVIILVILSFLGLR